MRLDTTSSAARAVWEPMPAVRVALPLLALLLLILAQFLASSAVAQLASPAGHLGVFVDDRGDLDRGDVPAGSPFDLYVVADFRSSPGPAGRTMYGWEASLEVDPRITVLDRLTNPAGAVNFGESDDFLVGIGMAPLDPSRSPLLLVTYKCLILAGEVKDARINVRSTDVANSFYGEGPGWVTDDATILVPFFSWGGVLLNPDEGLKSWGRIKNRFRQD